LPLQILVVDDDPATLEFYTEVLSSTEAEIDAFSDSERAATLIEQKKFHGIFIDLQMPGLDGFELARRIRQSSWNRATPIIVLTGHESGKAMEQVFRLGGTFYVQKPVNRRKLLNVFRVARGAMLQHGRRFIRVPLQIELACLAAGSLELRGNTVNLSNSGMLFEAEGSLEPGTHVRLSFLLPGQRITTNADGVAARVDARQRIGVRFTRLALKDREAIRQLVDREEKSST
jgi:CheY-like chemotaxis protein